MIDIIKDILKIILLIISGLFIFYLLSAFIDIFPRKYSKLVMIIIVIVYLILKRKYKNL